MNLLQSLRPWSFALLTALVLAPTVYAHAHEFKAGSLVIDHPWTRATPGGSKVASGYMTITNKGTTSDRLIGGSLEGAGRFELHETKMEGDMARMRGLPKGLEIKPGQIVKLAPGGYHVMFTGLKQPLKQGETLNGRLIFEKAGTIDIVYTVEGVGSQGSGQKEHSGHGGGHGH
ncbi:MAG: copper chaperone PCu(A)C [Xanthobacteraceae bacterium]